MFDTYYDIMVIVETLHLKHYTSTLSAGERTWARENSSPETREQMSISEQE